VKWHIIITSKMAGVKRVDKEAGAMPKYRPEISASLQDAIIQLEPGQVMVFPAGTKRQAYAERGRILAWIQEQKSSGLLAFDYVVEASRTPEGVYVIKITCLQPRIAKILQLDEETGKFTVVREIKI